MPIETPADKETRGRPTKCTPELTEEFARYMASGLYLEDAAGLCHIGRRTAYDWLERGEAALDAAGWDLDAVPEEERPFAAFSHTVRAAEAKALARNLALVQQGAQDRRLDRARAEGRTIIDEDTGNPVVVGDWRAAAEFLKMRKPDTWGNRKQTTEHTGPGGGPVQVEAWWARMAQHEAEDAADGGDGEA